ncbi:MAG TPA: hypothetical protein VKY31_15835 [Terriglobia bacterium]|nr:hypothetical protein [Terriglobia bacterium]
MSCNKPLLLIAVFLFSANVAQAGQYYFPIIAAGFSNGAGTDQFWDTEILVTNPTSKNLNGFLTFYGPDGTALSVTLRFVPGTAPGSVSTDQFFQFAIPANGAWRAYTNEADILKTGWVELDTPDGEVSPVVVFSNNSRKSGLLSEGSVFPSYPATLQRLFSDYGPRSANIPQFTDTTVSDIGVAIANPTANSANITMRLLNSAGVKAQEIQITLPPFCSVSRFVHELFSGLTGFQGTLEIQSDIGVAALGLRFTGPIFTTIPVVTLQ